jgi:hypothetical protein
MNITLSTPIILLLIPQYANDKQSAAGVTKVTIGNRFKDLKAYHCLNMMMQEVS